MSLHEKLNQMNNKMSQQIGEWIYKFKNKVALILIINQQLVPLLNFVSKNDTKILGLYVEPNIQMGWSWQGSHKRWNQEQRDQHIVRNIT